MGITDRTLEYRWGKHLISVRCGSEYHFHRAIRKHGKDVFEGIVLEECSTLDELKSAERRWIWLLATNHPEYGYNMTLGGDGIFGHKMTEQSRQRMRDSHLGKKLPEEQKRKISEAMKRRYSDPEERKRTSEALMGHEVSDATREKISQTHLGKIKSISEETKLKISIVNKGKRHSDASKQRLMEANLGKTYSDETRRKMSESAKRRWLNRKKEEDTINIQTWCLSEDQTKEIGKDFYHGSRP